MLDFIHQKKAKSHSVRAGFTLVEIMVTIAVSAIAVTAMASTFQKLQKNSAVQVDTNILQQSQRGVLSIMGKELRIIGRSLNKTKSVEDFCVTDIRHFNITSDPTDAQPPAAITPESHPILQFKVDLDDDGTLGNNETITYMLYDRDNNPSNGFDLGRTIGAAEKTNFIGGRELVAEGIDEIQYAFAFDKDDDGYIDRRAIPPSTELTIEWGVDTDNDGLLDWDMDLAQPLARPVAPEDIRVVRVWMLARGKKRDPEYRDLHGEGTHPDYGMGRRAIPTNLPLTAPFDRQLRRWLLSEIIHLRNL